VDLQAQLNIALDAEAALMAELDQIAAAQSGDPELASTDFPTMPGEIQGRPEIVSSSLAPLFVTRESHVDNFFEFTSDRERLRENLDNGAAGAEAYIGLSSQHADLFARNSTTPTLAAC
jgi:hypothetical protein